MSQHRSHHAQWPQTGRAEVEGHIFPLASSARWRDGQQVMWETTSNRCSAHWWAAREGSKYRLRWSDGRWIQEVSSLLWQCGPARLLSSCPYLPWGWQQGWAMPCERGPEDGTKTRSWKADFKGFGKLQAIPFVTSAPRQYFIAEESALVQMLTWKNHGRKIMF